MKIKSRKKAKTSISSILKKVQEAEKLRNEIDDKLLEIIQETEDVYAVKVTDFAVHEDDESIEVEYDFRFRNIRGSSCTTVPVKWLEEGFDYKYAALHRNDVDDPAALEAMSTMKKELAELKRLKEKYEH